MLLFHATCYMLHCNFYKEALHISISFNNMPSQLRVGDAMDVLIWLTQGHRIHAAHLFYMLFSCCLVSSIILAMNYL